MNLLLDAHLHTIASGHAFSTVKEYTEQAAKIGLSLIAITDHSPAIPGGANELYFRSIHDIRTVINDVEILTGVELNILNADGKVDLKNSIIKKLDVVIASLHSPCFAPSDDVKENTKAIINTMKNPHIKVIGHLGDHRYPFNIQEVVNAAQNTGTVIELNSGSFPPRNTRGDYAATYELMLTCRSYKVPVLVSSDSHFHTTMGDFETPIKILNDLNMPEELILNTSVELFKKTLAIS